MKRFLLTVLLTTLVLVAGATAALYNNGNISIEKIDTDHVKEIYVDGELVQQKNWTEMIGYNFSINFNDSMYVGK